MMEVYLTGAGKAWLQEHHPQGIVWENDVYKPFKLHGWTELSYEFTFLSIPCRIPRKIDGKTTIRKVE